MVVRFLFSPRVFSVFSDFSGDNVLHVLSELSFVAIVSLFFCIFSLCRHFLSFANHCLRTPFCPHLSADILSLHLFYQLLHCANHFLRTPFCPHLSADILSPRLLHFALLSAFLVTTNVSIFSSTSTVYCGGLFGDHFSLAMKVDGNKFAVCLWLLVVLALFFSDLCVF